MGRDQRYQQIKRGQWTITLARKPEAAAPPPQPAEATERLEKELTARGLTATRAKSIVKSVPAHRIERQIEHVDFVQAKHPAEIRSLAGFLRRAIEEDYAAPPGFVSRSELAKQKELARERSQAQAAERKRRAEAGVREREVEAQISAYLDSLSMAQVEGLDRQVLAEPAAREGYEKQFPGFRRLYMEHLRRACVRAELGLPASPES